MLFRQTKKRNANQRSEHKNRRRLFVIELLEQRTLLAAVTWDGEAGTLNWSDANNWSNNALPTSVDDVSIDIVGTNTVTSTGTVTIKSRTSNETVAVTAGTLTVQGNTSGTGTLRVGGGTVALTGANWVNAQTLSLISGTLNLGGSFT